MSEQWEYLLVGYSFTRSIFAGWSCEITFTKSSFPEQEFEAILHDLIHILDAKEEGDDKYKFAVDGLQQGLPQCLNIFGRWGWELIPMIQLTIHATADTVPFFLFKRRREDRDAR